VTITEPQVSEATLAFVDRFVSDARHAFHVLRAGGTLTANGTFSVVERIAGEDDRFVVVNDPGLWSLDGELKPVVRDRAGTVYAGNRSVPDAFGFVEVLARHPELTTAIHVHSPYLGAWSQTHRTFRINYVPAQRTTLARELPVYIDRRQGHGEFILEQLEKNPEIPGILEANGGSSVWGRNGFLQTARHIELLEEGARLQTLAQSLGGSRDYGPGVLGQQWKMGGIYERAEALGLLPKD
jgi:ribulose-5-phosphate 4-epimerase/fuculose-1-phosphate aldolase